MSDPGDNPKPRLGPGEWLLAAAFAVIIVIMAAQVFCRYVLNNSLGWAEELCTYLFVWLTFLGAAVAAKDRAHVRVDVVVRCLPAGARRVLRIALDVVVLAFLVVMVWLGWRWVLRTDRVSPALRLPEDYAKYAALPATFLIAAGFAVRDLVRAIGALRRKPGEAYDTPDEACDRQSPPSGTE